MPVTLYKRQKQILDFISQYVQKNGYSPTLQQIADALGVSSLATVHEHLNAMAKKKVIKKFEGAVRGIEIIDKKMGEITQGVELPILGFIAAGLPIEPYTDPGASTCVAPGMLSGKKRAFVLQVKGDSMIDDNIQDGDYVIIRQQARAESGQTVVAFINNEATLKRYYPKTGGIELHPRNPAYPVIKVNPDDEFRLGGVVLAVWRRYE